MAEAPIQLEGGTYEVLRNRLNGHATELRARLDKLNQDRKDTFGTIETILTASHRVATENNCVPRDLVCIGKRFILGCNVQFGLKSNIALSDVFSIFEEQDGTFQDVGLELIGNDQFEEAFTSLYKYYKSTTFTRFAILGPHLFMVFRVGKDAVDIKTFKWRIEGSRLVYLDNRSDHEYRFPPQHEFEWTRTHRDMHREGKHPHVSIVDKVFIETVGGDLTIKIEDNTASGSGILSEPVELKEQSLDDAEFFYSLVTPLVLLKVRPYQEKAYRYFVYNEKLKTAIRLDSIERACVLLPDSHGLIFANGYLLHNGETKIFENNPDDMMFERRIVSPNGEDYLYIFHNRMEGIYVLLSYNLIEQKVENPILCSGYSLFDDGRMILVRAESEAQKYHAIQVWQTPYTHANFITDRKSDSPLLKLGNKDIVRCMAECHNLVKLIEKEEAYETVYTDLSRISNALIDSWFWLKEAYAYRLSEILLEVRKTASAAVDEFQKVISVRRQTKDQMTRVEEETKQLLTKAASHNLHQISDYVKALADLSAMRGAIIGLRELRYADAAVIDALEKAVAERSDVLSIATVDYLLREEALTPYRDSIEKIASGVATVEKATEAKVLADQVDDTAKQLDLLIEIVSNLKIEDATKSSKIIDDISAIYSRVNQVREGIRNRRKALLGTEAIAEFSAQIKLLNQSVINYLDVADIPSRVDDYLNKLLVQLEGLEGRFADFDDFILQLAEKREEIQNAFETRKLNLVEARNKRNANHQAVAIRVLKGVQTKAEAMKTVEEINSYFASDLMVEKVREIIRQLEDGEDSVKAGELESRLKSVRENAVRQLKDRQELFEEGTNIIRFGRHRFSVNTQALDLTIIQREGRMYFHLTGTNFFELIDNSEFNATKSVWEQAFISETRDVYRAEFLAWRLLQSGALDSTAPILPQVQRFAGPRYQEGYVKGVHDLDAALILESTLQLREAAGLLCYRSAARVLANLYWSTSVHGEMESRLTAQIRGFAAVERALGKAEEKTDFLKELELLLGAFAELSDLWTPADVAEAASYLYDQIATAKPFVVSRDAILLVDRFRKHLETALMRGELDQSIAEDSGELLLRFRLAKAWIRAYLSRHEVENPFALHLIDEAALQLVKPTTRLDAIIEASPLATISGLTGSHNGIKEGVYTLYLPEFLHRMRIHDRKVVPLFESYTRLKHELVERFRNLLRLSEFQPKVLTSFVRNRLIDSVYLPRIGDNLAKQMGTVGAGKRTDLMGLLLLISPPGYGKTTLMEYVANRLGLVFVKINGPALGHRVLSLDPTEAPNAGAREELNRLNLAFEMGDNVMLYVDDIQHCHSEFLQKFISLCDGQRKIEGVFQGKSRTYDLRGRRVCVVMAGNPYTETGEKFRIPDMLANRADTYNLGDIIGESGEAFELSYIENSLTSNPTLNRLATRSQKDIVGMVKLADTGSREGIDFEGGYTNEEIAEFTNVIKKMRFVQSIILKVNLEYIRSAAQADEYRTEPPFKLQGSYRNMNKLAEKILPVMDDRELRTLVLSHYEGESQTLTSAAEANLLKFKVMTGFATEADIQRWEDIKHTFAKNLKLKSVGAGEDPMGHMLVQVADVNSTLSGVRDALGKGLSELSNARSTLATGLESVAEASRRPDMVIPPPTATPPAPTSAEPSRDFLEHMENLFTRLRLAVAAGIRPIVINPIVPPKMVAGPDGHETPETATSLETLLRWLTEEKISHAPSTRGSHIFQRGNGAPVRLTVDNGRLYFSAGAGNIHPALSRHVYRELLVLNTQILPVSIGLDRTDAEQHRLVILESRDLESVEKTEFLGIIHTFQVAVDATKALLQNLMAQSLPAPEPE